MDTTNMTFRLPTETLAKLKEMAIAAAHRRKQFITHSDLVRLWIDEMLSRVCAGETLPVEWEAHQGE